jgi:murein DD-endopeptidase MepM/ murein hydrolase activator NlpD
LLRFGRQVISGLGVSALWIREAFWFLGLILSTILAWVRDYVHGHIVAQAHHWQKLRGWFEPYLPWLRDRANTVQQFFKGWAVREQNLRQWLSLQWTELLNLVAAGTRPDNEAPELARSRKTALLGTQVFVAVVSVGLIWSFWPRSNPSQAARLQPVAPPNPVDLIAPPTPLALSYLSDNQSPSQSPEAQSNGQQILEQEPRSPQQSVPAKRLASILDLGNGQSVSVPLIVEAPGAPIDSGAISEKTNKDSEETDKATDLPNAPVNRLAIEAIANAIERAKLIQQHAAKNVDSQALAAATHGELAVQQLAGRSAINAAALSEEAPLVATEPASAEQAAAGEPDPSTARLPGRDWAVFAAPAPGENEHYWLSYPFPSGYNQVGSANYQFGSTAGGRYRPHHGLDIANPLNTPVLAVADGEVVHAGPDNPILLGPYTNFYGNAVVIRLNQRLQTADGEQDVYVLYGHLSEVRVTVGQQVATGDLVGLEGMTGIAIGPHLHLEVRIGQNSYWNSVNPFLWMKPAPGRGTVAVRLLTSDGRNWPGARLSLLRYSDGGTRWVRTVENYMDEENLGPDPIWGETGALGDLAAGNYFITGEINGEKIGQNITIYPGQTTFVELRTRQ